MNEVELGVELDRIKVYLARFDEDKMRFLDPKTDAILGHLVKSKYTLCWIAGLVFLNTVFSIWIGLKL